MIVLPLVKLERRAGARHAVGIQILALAGTTVVLIDVVGTGADLNRAHTF